MESHIGQPPLVIYNLWVLLHENNTDQDHVIHPTWDVISDHLLWFLHIAKNYPCQKDFQVHYRKDQKTVKKQSKIIAEMMLHLVHEVVSLFCFFCCLKEIYPISDHLPGVRYKIGSSKVPE